MMMDLLIVLSAITGIGIGYTWAVEKVRVKAMLDIENKAANLNMNIETFVKAYSDFNSRALEIESRFSSLEFKLTGVTGKA